MIQNGRGGFKMKEGVGKVIKGVGSVISGGAGNEDAVAAVVVKLGVPVESTMSVL